MSPPSAPPLALRLMVGALMVGACGHEAAEVAPAPAPVCPDGFAATPARTGRIEQRLGTTTEGRRLLELRPAETAVCYGPVAPSVVTLDEVLLVDERLGDDEAAARVAHLLMHVVEGNPLRLDGPGDCETKVTAALVAEGAALALEVQLRDTFGVTEPVGPLPFERADPAAIAGWLHDHPEGAEGVAPLGRDYRDRCLVAHAER